ncbi:MAG: hypothetical protein OEY94_05385 [Alphaproteobacteria bacterium]|nr:hypothetical protein [Alphaproteobacteria bacterium]
MNRRNKAILARNKRNKIWKTQEEQVSYARSKIWDELRKKTTEEKKGLKRNMSKKKDYNEVLVVPPGSGKKRK